MKSVKRQRLESELAAANLRIVELRAQLAATLATAFDEMPGASDARGSGVLLRIEKLGGGRIIPPVVIRDGLSPASVTALQADLCRSFELATLASPAMARAYEKDSSNV